MALSRQEMERIIREGGSVSIKGRVIRRIEDLPSAADLALGDEAQEAATMADIDAQIAKLQEQRTKLQEGIDSRKKAAQATAKKGSATEGQQ